MSTAGSTPYLLISHIAAAQTQKEVTANDAFDFLDAAINAQVAFALGDADITLSQLQVASGGVLQFTGALTADRFVNLPASDRAFIVRNSTSGGHNIIVQVSGGAGASVAVPNSIVALYCDGANVLALGGSVVSGGGGGGGGGGGSAQQEYIPTGVIDGSNAVFTVPTVPTGAFNLYKNGRRMMGGGMDFTLSGNTITYASGSIPQAGTTPDVHVAVY